MSDEGIWLPSSVGRREEMERRDVGAGLVRAFEQKGVTVDHLVKAARKGPDGQIITDLSQLATMVPGATNAMGAPFATDSGPDEGTFTPAGMGPGQPARPFPIGGEPRQFQYRTGFNFPTPPDTDRGIGAPLLRLLADQYDLVRQLIEMSKNEISSLEWDIVPREKNRKKREQIIDAEGDEIDRIKQFFEWPEAYMAKTRKGKWVRRGKVPWQQWISAQLEEYFVGDWLTIWPRVMMNGNILEFARVDGSTIKPLIDAEGRQPPPPYPAWQQYLYGVPRWSFSLEELLYRPKNPRNFTVYGFSHVEQMLLLINLALRYEMWLSSGYTDGSIPIGFMEFPENWTKDQIKEVTDELNAVTSGLSDSRQQWHGLPAGSKWHEMRPFSFDDKFANWLTEYCCALFGYSAQKLGFMPSRGGQGLGGTGFAEQQQQNAESSETIPTARWVEQLMNELLDRCLGRPDLSFEFVDLRAQNEKEQIESDQAALFAGVKAWDTMLQERGEDPVGVSEPFIMSPTGVIWTVADVKAAQEGQQRNPAPGLPMAEEEIEAANAPPPAPIIPGQTTGGPDADPGAAGAKPSPRPGAPGGPTDAKPVPAKPKPTPNDAKDLEKPKPAEKFDTSSGMQPHDLGPARAEELQRWKRKATNDLRDGRKPRPFRSDVIPEQMKTVIGDELTLCEQPGQVRAVFELRITKAAAKETSVAGLVVLADDTGRVLLIQRSNADQDDPARGTWEFPGGHLEDGETPIEGAVREWREETGMKLPAGEIRGQWKNGLYEGFIYAIAGEADLPLNPDPENRQVLNPDDPDGDDIETAAWWNPADLPDMPALREECGATPWALIDEATPDTATKAAALEGRFVTREEAWAASLGDGGLMSAHYRPAELWKQSCSSCAFYSAGTCSMFAASVDPQFTCDDWAATKAEKTAVPSNARQARTHKHEQQIATALGAITAARLARARKAGAATREALVLTDTDRLAIADAVTAARAGAYLAGANHALDQMGQPQIGQLPNPGLTAARTGGTDSADTFVGAWHDQLDELLDAHNATPGSVIDGLERFAAWRAHQEAVTQATSAYNAGKLFSFQAYPQVQLYEWSTAGDDAVCEDCEDRADGGPYEMSTLDVDELHPGCRCEVNPVEGEDVAGNPAGDEVDAE